MPHIVSISATSRPQNYTSHALSIVNDELSKLGLTVHHFDGRQLNLGFPGQTQTADSKKLSDAVNHAAAVVIATPEYHGSFCAYCKLIIENLGFPSVLAGKPILLVGVAAGRIGAIKSLEHLKGVCSHVGAIAVPGAVSIAGVQSVFTEEGQCLDEGSENALRQSANGLIEFLQDYVCPKHSLEDDVRQKALPWSASV